MHERQLEINVTRVRGREDRDIPLPQYMTEFSAGMDLFAAIRDDVILSPGEVRLIPTGIAVSIPQGYEAQVRPRSGLAVKHGVTVINSPGTIDADYRGEIGVGLINFGDKPYTVRRKDRIAQMIISKVYQARWNSVERLDETQRGRGGFGHTGKK